MPIPNVDDAAIEYCVIGSELNQDHKRKAIQVRPGEASQLYLAGGLVFRGRLLQPGLKPGNVGLDVGTVQGRMARSEPPQAHSDGAQDGG